jgi:hypothetical protein
VISLHQEGRIHPMFNSVRQERWKYPTSPMFNSRASRELEISNIPDVQLPCVKRGECIQHPRCSTPVRQER